MIIAVTKTGKVELREPDNFRAFKILDELAQGPEKLGRALDGLAKPLTDGKAAWVSIPAVAKLLATPPTPEWTASFEGMIGFARKHGWVNDAENAVRAHIESVGT